MSRRQCKKVVCSSFVGSGPRLCVDCVVVVLTCCLLVSVFIIGGDLASPMCWVCVSVDCFLSEVVFVGVDLLPSVFGLISGGLASSMCVGVFQLVSSGPRLCVCQHDLCFCCLSDCLMVFQ